MKTKRRGCTGLHVSEICLGAMTFGAQADEAASHELAACDNAWFAFPRPRDAGFAVR